MYVFFCTYNVTYCAVEEAMWWVSFIVVNNGAWVVLSYHVSDNPRLTLSIYTHLYKNQHYAFLSTQKVKFDVSFVNKYFCCKNQRCFFEHCSLGAMKKLISIKPICDGERMTAYCSPWQTERKAQSTVIMSQDIWPDPLLVSLTSYLTLHILCNLLNSISLLYSVKNNCQQRL